MLRKTSEQVSVGLSIAQRGNNCAKSVLPVPISAGLYASERNGRFHFQGYSLPSWGAFSQEKGYSSRHGHIHRRIRG